MKNSSWYFTQETEDAILLYNSLDRIKDYSKRNKIFEDHIYYPFMKIAEHIVSKYKAYSSSQLFVDSKEQTVSYMIMVIDKYDNTKGSAFSYFNQVAKNCILIDKKKNIKTTQRNINIESIESIGKHKLEAEIERNWSKKNISETDEKFTIEKIKKIIQIIYKIINKTSYKHKKIRNYGIVKLLENLDNINNLNREHSKFLLSEITNNSTDDISRELISIRKCINEIK